MDSFIRLDNVVKEYLLGGTVQVALGGISLAVERGDFVSIMGPSGSGKSTLISLIGGLGTPTRGRVTVDGIDLGSLGHDQLADFRREYVGFVFQAFHLVPYLSVIENVMLPIAVERGGRAAKRLRALTVLNLVGLGGKEDRLPSQLSGGEQERVAIARALVNEPEIILADEPTGNLDSRTGDAIMEGLAQLNRAGKTVIMVTHNPENARRASRIVTIKDGVVEEETAPCLTP